MRASRRLAAALSLGLAGIVAMAVAPLSSVAVPVAPTPPFTQCPALGLDTSCAVLVVINADHSISTFSDSTQGPFDGIEDTLVGVQNNSSTPVTGLRLTSSTDIFGFDGDGLCTVSGAPAGCPFGPTGYEGPGTSFTNIASSGTAGTVLFGAGGIPTAKSAYFSLEEKVTDFSNVTFGGISCPNGATMITGFHNQAYLLNGGNWCFIKATVTGTIQATRATVTIIDSNIGGNVQSYSGNGLTICGSTPGATVLNGSLIASQSPGFVLVGEPDVGCAGNTIKGSVTFNNNNGGLELAANHIGSTVGVNNNSKAPGASGDLDGPTGTEISGNTSTGLGCSGNAPAPTNDGIANTTNGPATGQCAPPFT
jgi:hypothetical protein